MLRHNPEYISLAVPLVTCLLTMLFGTGHLVYTLLPIIYAVTIQNSIRPERPLAASSIGSQMGIIASPVSMSTGSLVAMLTLPGVGATIDFINLLSLAIPATLSGILAIALFSGFLGKEFWDDDAFLGLSIPRKIMTTTFTYRADALNTALLRSSWRAMGILSPRSR